MRSEHREPESRGSGGRGRRTVVAVATAGALALAVVIGGSGASAARSSKRPPVPAIALKAALAYTGGKAGAANNSLSPLYVGWVSDETAITGHAGNTGPCGHCHEHHSSAGNCCNSNTIHLMIPFCFRVNGLMLTLRLFQGLAFPERRPRSFLETAR